MRRALVLAAVAAVSAGATVLWASQEPRIKANTETSEVDTLTVDEELALSHTVARILGHTNRAWNALVANDVATAKTQVGKALTLVRIADAARPRYKVTSHIEAGELSYDDEQVVPRQYIDIFDELEEVAVLGPAQEAQDSVAVGLLPVLDDIELEYSSAKFDLPLAELHLGEARAALENGRMAEASKALEAIQEDAVVFEVTTADLPLSTAKANLLVAQERADSDDTVGAQAALQAAAGALERYRDLPASTHSEEAARIGEEIEGLAAHLGTSDDPSGSIQGWWNTVKTWLD